MKKTFDEGVNMNNNFVIKLSGFILTAVAFATPAAAFTLRDDPSSTCCGDASTTATADGNVYTVHDLLVQNVTANSLPELSFTVPFVWQKVDETTRLPMEWRNDLNGWFTSNFNNTGTSLTVSLTNPPATSVLMGNLADLTGNQQLPLTEPCFGSPSCIEGDGRPPETRNSTDLVPLFSLGAFAPNEEKRFDVSFTYAFGDGRTGIGDVATAFFAYSVSAIPEPESYAMLLAGLGLMGFLARRRKVN